ncbi:MAG: hypothetical protein Q9M11_03425 [Mariprofundaceae bacterium]|nr:hypothetical protein [Mariprofundaceae bacterium]
MTDIKLSKQEVWSRLAGSGDMEVIRDYCMEEYTLNPTTVGNYTNAVITKLYNILTYGNATVAEAVNNIGSYVDEGGLYAALECNYLVITHILMGNVNGLMESAVVTELTSEYITFRVSDDCN